MTPAARAGSLVLSAALGLLLVACGPTASATSQTPSPTAPAPTASPAAQPTATPLGANPCGSSSSADVASRLNAWGIPKPTDAIVVDQGDLASDGPSGGATYTLFGVCAKGSSPDAVWAFYVAHMPSSGWTQSATIPTIGNSNEPCGYKYCWTKDVKQGSALIVTLKNMVVKGSDTEFTLVYEGLG